MSGNVRNALFPIKFLDEERAAIDTSLEAWMSSDGTYTTLGSFGTVTLDESDFAFFCGESSIPYFDTKMGDGTVRHYAVATQPFECVVDITDVLESAQTEESSPAESEIEAASDPGCSIDVCHECANAHVDDTFPLDCTRVQDEGISIKPGFTQTVLRGFGAPPPIPGPLDRQSVEEVLSHYPDVPGSEDAYSEKCSALPGETGTQWRSRTLWYHPMAPHLVRDDMGREHVFYYNSAHGFPSHRLNPARMKPVGRDELLRMSYSLREKG